MTLSMYGASVPVFISMLENSSAILGKAEAFAVEKGLDPAGLLRLRLAPDMLPLVLQVHIITDGARGSAARLAGRPLPSAEALDFAVFNRGDEGQFSAAEESFAALGARLQRSLDYLRALRPDEIDGSEERPVVLAMGGRTRSFEGLPFLLHYALPNFYFHVAMIYAILRHAGVALGKRDYEGAPVYVSGAR
ncbi:DUF1993 domain-containing protein [Kaistia dalseonensis]|uniref:DUF1993 domain-containing protein n=1 Tax=Kaistia dalseonensis TaxID=410840 RepID=A0ABU0H614_9HYPH|nr:DUF1993 domain-containing protein [Kaistia dalseonensis]MCX5495165.1 DUF1993 domain-containing protein [Kaistia dalseonensis]MDQ0437748.1 hypothetical protein [Kaistia dalseonensis]